MLNVLKRLGIAFWKDFWYDAPRIWLALTIEIIGTALVYAFLRLVGVPEQAAIVVVLIVIVATTIYMVFVKKIGVPRATYMQQEINSLTDKWFK